MIYDAVEIRPRFSPLCEIANAGGPLGLVANWNSVGKDSWCGYMVDYMDIIVQIGGRNLKVKYEMRVLGRYSGVDFLMYGVLTCTGYNTYAYGDVDKVYICNFVYELHHR